MVYNWVLLSIDLRGVFIDTLFAGSLGLGDARLG